MILRYRFFWLFMTLVPLAHASSNESLTANFSQAMQVYGDKLGYYSSLAKNNDKIFPITDWFASLNEADKKRVVIYLYLDNGDKCSTKEQLALVKVLDKFPQVTIITKTHPDGVTLGRNYAKIGTGKNIDHKKEISGLDFS